METIKTGAKIRKSFQKGENVFVEKITDLVCKIAASLDKKQNRMELVLFLQQLL